MQEKIADPKILYEDTHLVVISKPAGLLSQGESTGDRNLVDYLRTYFGRHYVGLVHRLDRNTSGLMVVAKRTKAAQRLTLALQQGKICRKYLGWQEGKLSAAANWTHWLLKDEKTNIVKVVQPKTNGAKIATMKATPLRTIRWKGHDLTLSEFELETGRGHQIRVQSSQEGLPLLGDAKYGSQVSFHRPALHSYSIEFPHPMSGEFIKLEEISPVDWPKELSGKK